MKPIRIPASLLFLICAAAPAQQPLSSRNARRAPELEKASVYQVWMRAFTPQGTLQATAARLPYIADLGASIVYLSPLQTHSLAGGAAKGWTLAGPYGIKDYTTIDSEYGTQADLKALAEKAHSLHLKVIMDIVLYHMAVDNPLMKMPGFFMQTPAGQPILGNWGRPRPDFSNPKLREFLVNNMVHWVRDVGLDGFRCDVAGGVPLSFWEEARDALDKVNPDVILLAEAEMPEQQLKAFDISYNFSYLKQTVQIILSQGEPASRIRDLWERQKALWPRGSRLLYSSDNHDQDRATRLFGEKAAYAANVLSFTLDGIPFLYNGQEIGDTTPTDYPERRPIHWELGERSGWAHQQEAMLAKYKRIFAMRKQEPSLTSGELKWLTNSAPESLVTFLRRKGEDDQILVVVNLSNRKVPVTVDLAAADFMPATDLLTGKKESTAFSPGHISFPAPLEGFTAMVLKRLPRQVMNAPTAAHAGKPYLGTMQMIPGRAKAVLYDAGF
jgi:glycosidase